VATAVLAALVTAATLVAVASLRWRWMGSPGAEPYGAPPAPSVVDVGCGQGPCQVLAIRSVDGVQIELKADAEGGNGRFQADAAVLQTTVTQLGARVDAGSLSCVSASESACLVGAPFNGGRIAQLLVDRAGVWRSVDKPYYSDLGVIVLENVSGTDAPEVVVGERSPVQARVYALDGGMVGCTRKYSYPAQLRGWPSVRILAGDLRPCS
jgi:hypothetical protein